MFSIYAIEKNHFLLKKNSIKMHFFFILLLLLNICVCICLIKLACRLFERYSLSFFLSLQQQQKIEPTKNCLFEICVYVFYSNAHSFSSMSSPSTYFRFVFLIFFSSCLVAIWLYISLCLFFFHRCYWNFCRFCAHFFFSFISVYFIKFEYLVLSTSIHSSLLKSCIIQRIFL